MSNTEVIRESEILPLFSTTRTSLPKGNQQLALAQEQRTTHN